MKPIDGIRSFPFTREAVFNEGTVAKHWKINEGGILINPKNRTIYEGGEVGMGVSIAGISKTFTAEVVKCVENKLVVVAGEIDGFGDANLSFELDDGCDPCTTDAYYCLTVNLGRLASMTVGKPLYGQLKKDVPMFADTLQSRIIKSLGGEQPVELRKAS